MHLHQGWRRRQSKNAAGMRACVRRNRVGSRCSGKERDGNNLDYFGARYYDGSAYNATYRWISADPITAHIYDPPSLNKYAYCRDDPVNLVDPDGNEPQYSGHYWAVEGQWRWVGPIQEPFGAIHPDRSSQARAAGAAGGGNASPFNPPKDPCVAGEELTQIYYVGAEYAAIAYVQAGMATRLTQELVEKGVYTEESQNGGAADAFRHCYWSCLMAKVMGVAKAYTVGVVHEDCNSANTRVERDMDLHNNWLGIMMGQPEDDCQEKCQKTVATGVARILVP